ncbi:MAG: hypothetical protein ACOH1P_09855 [Lysobacter sp.]
MAAALLLALLAPAAMAQDADPAWKFSGDLRGGYFASERTARDDTESDSDALQARLRAALQRGFGDHWTFRARAAARFSSEQDDMNVYLRGYAPTEGGTRFGDITLDELYLGYTAPDNGYKLRVGRFQTGFTLAGVASKGLDRVDSPSVDVTWTDGVHLELPIANGWRGHAIAQYRNRHTVARNPLDYSDNASRTSLFLGLANNQPLGPITQRMVSLNWLPSSLADQGVAASSRQDYLSIDARVSASWPLREDGLRLATGLEVGYAPNTPRGSVVGTGHSGDSDGLAWQISVNLHDIAPGHSVGLVYGRVDAGWLLSPDFRPNDTLTELTYQWRFNPDTSLEARVRERKEIEIPSSAPRARVDHDLYVRVTHRF